MPVEKMKIEQLINIGRQHNDYHIYTIDEDKELSPIALSKKMRQRLKDEVENKETLYLELVDKSATYYSYFLEEKKIPAHKIQHSYREVGFEVSYWEEYSTPNPRETLIKAIIYIASAYELIGQPVTKVAQLFNTYLVALQQLGRAESLFNTLLHDMLYLNHVGIIHFLLSNSCTVCQRSVVNKLSVPRQKTPLMQAAENGSFEIFQLLLRCPDIEISPSANDKETVLHTACQAGRADIIGLLLQHSEGKKLINTLQQTENCYYNYAPLHLVAELGHFDIAEQLIEAGADCNLRLSNVLQEHYLPWQLCVRRDSATGSIDALIARDKLCILLLKHTSQQVNYTELALHAGKNALVNTFHYAVSFTSVVWDDVVSRELLDHAFHQLGLSEGYCSAEVKQCYINILSVVIDNASNEILSATINGYDGNALHKAAHLGLDGLVEKLLKKSELSVAAPGNGDYPLYRTCRYSKDSIETVKAIITYAPKQLFGTTCSGDTLLHLTIKSKSSGIMSYLLKQEKHDISSLLNKQNNQGETFLHLLFSLIDFSVAPQNKAWLDILIDCLAQGLDVTLKDNRGLTAIELALEKNDRRSAFYLQLNIPTDIKSLVVVPICLYCTDKKTPEERKAEFCRTLSAVKHLTANERRPSSTTAETINIEQQTNIANQTNIYPTPSVSTPQVAVLTSLLLKQLQQRLAGIYRHYGRVPRLFADDTEDFQLTTDYMRLSLIKKPFKQLKEEDKADGSKPKTSPFEEDYHYFGITRNAESQKQVALADLFKKNAQARVGVQRVILMGRAGIGKSVFSQYVAYLWGQHVVSLNSIQCPAWLSAHQFLFYIPLRYLSLYVEDRLSCQGDELLRLPISLSDKTHDLVAEVVLFMLKAQNNTQLQAAWQQTLLTQVQISQLLSKHSANICWVLDGLDEIIHEVMNVNSFYHDLLGYWLSQSHVLLTSRPLRIPESLLSPRALEQECQWVEALGFNDEVMTRYIQQYGQTQATVTLPKENILLTYFKSNPVLWSLGHIPIQLALLCAMKYSEIISPSISANSTETTPTPLSLNTIDIYQDLLHFLQRRYMRKYLHLSLNDFRNQDQTRLVQEHTGLLLDVLSELAARLMAQGDILFTGTLLDEVLQAKPERLRQFYENWPVKQRQQFEQTNEKQLAQLSTKERHQWAVEEALHALGSLHITTIQARLSDSKTQLYFVHSSFREYLAALQFVKQIQYCLNNKRDSSQNRAINHFMARYKYKPRYLLFWQFVVGEASQNEVLFNALQTLWCSMLLLNARKLAYFEEQDERLRKQWLAGLSARLAPGIQERLLAWVISDINHHCASVCITALQTLEYLPTWMGEFDGICASLSQRMRDKNNAIRENALRAMAALGTSWVMDTSIVDALLTMLTDKYYPIQVEALEVIRARSEQLVTDTRIIDRVIIGFSDKNGQDREVALALVGALGTSLLSHSRIIAALRVSLGSNDKAIQEDALRVMTLDTSWVKNTDIIDALMTTLADKDYFIRKAAWDAVRASGERLATDTRIIDRVVTGLSDKSEQGQGVALAGIEALGSLLLTHSRVIDALSASLRNKDKAIQKNALRAVASLGPQLAMNVKIVDALVLLLEHKDYSLRALAWHTVRALGTRLAADTRVVDALVLELGYENDDIRERYLFSSWAYEKEDIRKMAWMTVEALGVSLAADARIIDAVIKLMDEDWIFQKTARRVFRVFRVLGPSLATNMKIIDALLIRLASEDHDVREMVWEMLSALGTADSRVIDVLLIEFADKNINSRRRAWSNFEALASSVKITPRIISALLVGLADSDKYVRESVFSSIKAMSVSLTAEPKIIDALLIEFVNRKNWISPVVWKMYNALVASVWTALAPRRDPFQGGIYVTAEWFMADVDDVDGKAWVDTLEALWGSSVLLHCLSHPTLSQPNHRKQLQRVIQHYLMHTTMQFIHYPNVESPCLIVLGWDSLVNGVCHSLTAQQTALLASVTKPVSFRCIPLIAEPVSMMENIASLSSRRLKTPNVSQLLIDAEAVAVDSSLIKNSYTDMNQNLSKAIEVEKTEEVIEYTPPIHDMRKIEEEKKSSNLCKDFSSYLNTAEKSQLRAALKMIRELLAQMNECDEGGDRASLIRLELSLTDKENNLATLEISKKGAKAYLKSIVEQVAEIEATQKAQAAYFR